MATWLLVPLRSSVRGPPHLSTAIDECLPHGAEETQRQIMIRRTCPEVLLVAYAHVTPEHLGFLSVQFTKEHQMSNDNIERAPRVR